MWTEAIAQSSASKGACKIQGILIHADKPTRNGIYYPANELQLAASTWVDKPVLKNHENLIDSIIGRVATASYSANENSVIFSAIIQDELVTKKIQEGLITHVSIGATVGSVEEEEINGETYQVARDLCGCEISLVAVPGDPGATFQNANIALMESYNNKEKKENKNKMSKKEELKKIIKEAEELLKKEQGNKKEDKTKGEVVVDDSEEDNEGNVISQGEDGLELFKDYQRCSNLKRLHRG